VIQKTNAAPPYTTRRLSEAEKLLFLPCQSIFVDIDFYYMRSLVICQVKSIIKRFVTLVKMKIHLLRPLVLPAIQNASINDWDDKYHKQQRKKPTQPEPSKGTQSEAQHPWLCRKLCRLPPRTLPKVQIIPLFTR